MRRTSITVTTIGAAAVLAGQILFALHKPYPGPPRFSADPLLPVSLPLFFGGALLTLVGLLRLPLPTLKPGEAPPGAGRTSWLHKCAVALILLLAFAVRAYRLTEMPPPLFDDEANVALDAMKYLDNQFPPGTYTGWFETPVAFSAVNSIALHYFGPTVLGSRVTGLVFSTLTVLALYFVARAMMSPSTALLVMLALAMQRWHMTLSRFAANHITLPFLVALAFCFTARAFDLVLGAVPTLRFIPRRPGSTNRGGAVAWYQQPLFSVVAGGFFLGASMYTYLVSRLVAFGAFLFLVYLVIHAIGVYVRRRDARPSLAPLVLRRVSAAILYGLVYLAVFAPLGLHFYRHPDLFTNRYKFISLPQQMGIGTGKINWEPLLTNLTAYPMMLNYAGNEVSRYGPPFRPVLNVICGTLFALGMVCLLRHWWRPANMFCLLWVSMPLLGGIVTWSETPSPFRTLVATTAVAVIMVIPIHYAMLGIAGQPRWARRRTRVAFFGATTGLLVLSGAMDLYTYWFVQRLEPSLHRYCNFTEYDVARRVQAISDDHPIYLRPHLYNFSSVKLLNWKRANINLFVPSEYIPLLQPTDTDTYIFLDLFPTELMKAIRLFHPSAQLLDYPLAEVPGFGHSQVVISGKELAESRGLWVTTTQGTNRRTRSLEAPSPATADLRHVSWEAILDASQTGTYQFSVRSTRPLGDRCRLTVTGQPIATSNQTVTLLAGRAPLQLLLQGMPPDEHIELRWHPPNADWEPIPLNRLYAFPSAEAYGLRGTYYLGMNPAGTPFTERVDLTPAANESMPSPHSVRWTGFVNIPAEGDYTFEVRADDGARLSLDGALVIDRWEAGGTVNGQATLRLSKGPHPIQLDYFDQGGGRIFEFTWRMPDGKSSSIVPFDVLSHPPTPVNAIPFREHTE